MSVGYGSPLTSANTNAAFVSRTQDTSMVGTLDNQNPTDATGTTDGAIHTAGGLGVEKQAHIEQVFVESLGGGQALITSGLKEVTESVTTAAEIAYVSGVTSGIQAQIDNKANDGSVVHNTGNESVAGEKTFTDDTFFDQDVVIGGNLTVNGTTTTINTAMLDVTDTNITVNNGGNDASSEGAGLTVDRTGTNGSFVYANALASRFKAGDLGSESEVITSSTVQTLSGNKTFSAKLNVSGELNLSETINSTATGASATVPTLTATVRLTNGSLLSVANIDDAFNGKVVILTNDTGNAIDILNDTGGTAIKRILTGSGDDLTLEDESSVILSYNSNDSRWMVVGGTGSGGSSTLVGYQETPAGASNGSNVVFGPLANVPSTSDSIIVFLDGIALEKTQWTYSTPNITFSTAPAFGQTVYVFYVSGGAPMGGGTEMKTEFRTISGGEATAKQLTLAFTPVTPGYVLVDIIGGTAQEFSVDYTISTNVFDWSGYALDGVLTAGDKIRFHYSA